MHTFDDIPFVELLQLGSAPLHVTISGENPPALDGLVQSHWAALVRENPNLFDGRILNVLSIDSEFSRIHCRADRYSRLVAQPKIKTQVRLLATTGLLLANDKGGRSYVLMGLRSNSSSVYPGQWEFGPAGGLHAPSPNILEFGLQHVVATLCDEAMEELGLDLEAILPECHVTCLGIARDHLAMSDDLIIQVELPELPTLSAANWEYADVRWVPTDSLDEFARSVEPPLIPPTRALARRLGWMSGPSRGT